MTRVLVAPSTRKIQNHTGKKQTNQQQKIYSTNDTDRTTELERKTHSYTNHAALKEVHIEYIPFFFFLKKEEAEISFMILKIYNTD